jgi:hypothetical protein
MRALAVFAGMLVITALGACSKESLPEYSLVLEGHRFTPDRLSVPAQQKFRLKIENRDDSADEFDSSALGTEKVVPGKSSGWVVVGPLNAGSYPFMGEFHHETAEGVITAK